MRIKRFRAFLIDFIIITVLYYAIHLIIKPTAEMKQLQIKENDIIEQYTSGQIRFDDYFKGYSDVVYRIDKGSLGANLTYLIIVIIYFVIVPFLWKGRTLGSFMNGIQVERFDKGSISIIQLFIRNLVVVGLGYLIIRNIGVLIIPSKYYFLIVSIVGILQIVLAIFSANMILFTKEKRGIQDLISNTEMTKIIRKRKKIKN